MSEDEAVTGVVLVPNGTRALSETVEAYVARYRSFLKQTAESIINLAETLVEAKQSLTPEDFEQFCEEVRIVNGGPTFKKMQVIGINATRFTPHLDQLPNTWTTIYKLAALPPADFQRLAERNVLTPFMTASEVGSQIKERKVQDPRKTFTLSVGSLSDADIKILHGELLELQADYKFDLKVSDAISKGME